MQTHLLGFGILGGAAEGDRYQALRFAAAAYFLGHDAAHRHHAQIAECQGKVGGRQAGQIGRQQGLHFVDIKTAGKYEGHALGAGKTLLVDGDAAVEVQLGKIVRTRDPLHPRMVLVQGGHGHVLEHGFGLRHGIAALLHLFGDEGLEQVRIAPGAGEFQVHELEHGLHIPAAAVAADKIGVHAHAGADRCGFTGEYFLQFQGRVVFQTHARDHGVRVAGIEAVGFLEQGLAAKAAGAHDDLVVTEIGRLEHDLDTVGQGEPGQTELLVLAFGHDPSRGRRRLHQLRGQRLFIVGSDLHAFGRIDGSEQMGLAWRR